MTDENKPSGEHPSSDEHISDAKEDIAASGGAGSKKTSTSGGTKKAGGKTRTAKPKAAPEAPKKPKDEDTVVDRNLALIAHLSGVLLYPAPGLNIIIPGLILLLKGKESEFVGHHARQALLFQSIMTGAMILFVILSFVLIGLPVLLLVMVCHVVFVIIATLAASRGEWYTYPLMDRV